MASSAISSLTRGIGSLPPESIIFGRSSAMAAIQQKIKRIAATNVPILLQGESGTGKDIIARLLHQLSPWASGPWVKVNCPAIPGALLESELFGYEKGAFTGAYEPKAGQVELADRGTLFFDEISELEPSLQAKLLQVLQDGQFCRIGAQENKKVEVRVVCATNHDLEHEIELDKFRQDLYYRISVVTLKLPSLRERMCDIEDLANYFLQYYNVKYKCKALPLSPHMLASLARHDWPGNVRELENVVRRCVIFGSEEAISAQLWSRKPQDPSDSDVPFDGVQSLKQLTRKAVHDLERKIIFKVLKANNWNRKRTARVLSISYRALLYKISETGLNLEGGHRQTPPADGTRSRKPAAGPNS